MGYLTQNHLDQAAEYWRNGQFLEAGKIIFENLPVAARPGWASRILELAIERTGTKSPQIDHIIHISNHPSEWAQAHKAFDAARRVVLDLDRKQERLRSAKRTMLLRLMELAELTAKVTYNATHPPDEFDEDCGWWIAVYLKRLLDSLHDDSFSQRMWLAFCFDEESD